MKKRFLTGRGLLAGAVLAAGGGAFAFWATPAQAAGTPPQISVVTSHAGTATVTLGHPKPEATAHISAGNVAYDPSNGDEAVSVVTGTGQAHVYLIAGATEPNEYHIETAPGTYGTLVKGDVYLVAGDGTEGMTSDPGASTTLTGGSTSPVATSNNIAPVSLTFDHAGNLLIAESHSNTAQTASGIQIVAQAACSSSCPYGYSSLAAGDLYTIAGVGAWRGTTRTPAITFEFQVKGWGVAVDAQGNITDSATGAVLFLNEQTSSVTRYGKTLAAGRATIVAGTATGTGSATCGGGAKSVVATGNDSVNLQFPHPVVDANGNIYVNDNRDTAGTGCTWVLPAETGTLDGQTMTAGHLYSLTGAATTTAATDGAVANTTSFPNASGVALDPAGNVVVTLAGETPALRVIAESNGTYYDQAMTKGHVYTISGGAGAARTTTPGNATGFEFAGGAPTVTVPTYGITSLTTGAPGDLLLTDGSSATTGTFYEVTRGPTSTPAPTVTSVTLSASPAGSSYVGTTVTLTATLTPSSAAGSVQFFVATTSLGTSSVSGGVATLMTSTLPKGSDSLTATFTPTTSTAYAGSTSSALSYTVSTAPSTGGSERITETVPSAGTFTLTVPTSAQVTLSAPVKSGATESSTGTLDPVTVSDSRNTVPGWTVSGEVGNFTSGGHTLTGNDLGWTPKVTSQSSGQDATAGGAVAPGATPGLKTASTWASAPSGSGYGTASLGAGLHLVIPSSTRPGTYVATFTVTAI